jgi:hypothetical protein
MIRVSHSQRFRWLASFMCPQMGSDLEDFPEAMYLEVLP